MPVYHFHDADGSRWLDECGTDLPNEEAARHIAMQVAGDMLKDDPARVWKHGHWRVEVTDEQNILLFTIAMLALDAPRPGDLSRGQPVVSVSSTRKA